MLYYLVLCHEMNKPFLAVDSNRWQRSFYQAKPFLSEQDAAWGEVQGTDLRSLVGRLAKYLNPLGSVILIRWITAVCKKKKYFLRKCILVRYIIPKIFSPVEADASRTPCIASAPRHDTSRHDARLSHTLAFVLLLRVKAGVSRMPLTLQLILMT